MITYDTFGIYMMLVPKATSYDAVYIAAMYIIFNIDTIYDISGRSCLEYMIGLCGRIS